MFTDRFHETHFQCEFLFYFLQIDSLSFTERLIFDKFTPFKFNDAQLHISKMISTSKWSNSYVQNWNTRKKKIIKSEVRSLFINMMKKILNCISFVVNVEPIYAEEAFWLKFNGWKWTIVYFEFGIHWMSCSLFIWKMIFFFRFCDGPSMPLLRWTLNKCI